MSPPPVEWTLDLVRASVRRTSDDCWLWHLSTRSDGAGQVRVAGRQLAAHRFVYELAFGPIPDRMHLHHECRTYRCVNPEHLRPITQAEHNRLHLTRTHCKRGHEFTPDNTDGRGGKRTCSTCRREYQRARYHARRAAA